MSNLNSQTGIWVYAATGLYPVDDSTPGRQSPSHLGVQEWVVTHGVVNYPHAIYFFWDGVSDLAL